MSRMPPTTYQHLEPRQDSAYKSLFVKGTRIRARALYGLFASREDPWTPELIATQYGLPLDAVKEAILYCRSNPPELTQDSSREDALMEAMGVNDPQYKRTGSTRVLSSEEICRILRK